MRTTSIESIEFNVRMRDFSGTGRNLIHGLHCVSPFEPSPILPTTYIQRARREAHTSTKATRPAPTPPQQAHERPHPQTMLRFAARRSTPAATAATRRAAGMSTLRPRPPTTLAAAIATRRGLLPLPALQLLFLQPQQRRALSSGPGGQAWVSPDAVPKGENLRKFSRNLTKEAMEGKLDPVRCWGTRERERERGGCASHVHVYIYWRACVTEWVEWGK